MRRRREDAFDFFVVVIFKLFWGLLGIVGIIGIVCNVRLGIGIGIGIEGRWHMPRWLGAAHASLRVHSVISSLPLAHDVTIDALTDAERDAITKHWLHRASAEHGVAIAFTLLRPRLVEVHANGAVLALADKAIDDERRHGDLCVELARLYSGRRHLATPAPRDGTLPNFETRDEAIEVALIVMGMCCVNESIASEWIRSCWQAATSPTAVFANREHLKDEIDHARLGWAHFASTAVTTEMKRILAPWIQKIVAVNVSEWKKADEYLPSAGIAAHGHLSHADHLEVIDAAVRDVVMPGFAHVGLV